jgi:hypothetical protein
VDEDVVNVEPSSQETQPTSNQTSSEPQKQAHASSTTSSSSSSSSSSSKHNDKGKEVPSNDDPLNAFFEKIKPLVTQLETDFENSNLKPTLEKV